MSKAQDKRIEFRREYDKVLEKAKDLGNFALVRAKDMRSGQTMIETSYTHIQKLREDAQAIDNELFNVSMLLEEYLWEKEQEKNFATKQESWPQRTTTAWFKSASSIFMNKRRFEFGGREYSTEFKYILAMIGGKYGYDSRINDKYVIIKNQA